MSEGNDAPPSRSGGAFGRAFRAILTVLFAAALAVLLVGALYIWMGFSLDAPQQLSESRTLLATVQAQNTLLQLQNTTMQTQVADLDRRSVAGRDDLDLVRSELAQLSGLRDQIAQSDNRSATMIAEARDSRDAIAVFATAEAGRAELLDELQRRSDRVERFLQRLSDISDDAALDLGSGTPLPILSPTASATPMATTPTASAATPTEVDAQPSVTPRATSTRTATPEP